DPPRARKFNRPTKLMFDMDPPDHTRLRRLMTKAFTVGRVEELRPKIRDLARQFIDDMVAAGPPADLVEDFALPIPVVVICELLGVPAEDRPRFRVWTDATLSTSPLTVEETQIKREELVVYIREIIAARRAAPSGDLISALIEACDVED